MSWFDKIFIAGYFLAIILVQCIWQARLFKNHKTINHWWHGLYYTLTVLPILYFFWPYWWQVGLLALFTRIAFFDFMLNAIRGKNLFYNSDKDAGSIVDRVENVFTVFWVNVFKVCCVGAFIIIFIKVE